MSQNCTPNRAPRKILGVNNGKIPSQAHEENFSTETIPKQQLQINQLRLGRVMNQEFHPLWPYGATFLSPMLPGPNLPLPYAVAAGGMPYGAVPLYQTPTTALNPLPPATMSVNGTSNGGGCSSSSSCASSSAGGRTNTDSGKMFIQIGLQCVNQNNPVNVNSLNDMTLKNFIEQDVQKGISFLLIVNGSNAKYSLLVASNSHSCSPNLSIIDNELACKTFLAAGGDASNQGTILCEDKCNDFIHLALFGSEVSEKVAYGHRNRPCFKKIDSLCARTKQDLIRPDGVLPNINSQGIAWAVKDLIFVFTRLVNAWIIVKGYVYKTPDGLNKVKSSLSPEFARSFIAWHEATSGFIDNIIKSIISLENLVQSQKNIYQKPENNVTKNLINTTNFPSSPIKQQQFQSSTVQGFSHNISTPSTVFDDTSFDFLNSPTDSPTTKSKENLICNKKYLYTMVEDSEGRQRQATVNGTYFKTGTYNPIKKNSAMITPIPGLSEQSNLNGVDDLENSMLLNNNWYNEYEDAFQALTSLKVENNQAIAFQNCSNYICVTENEKQLGRDLVDKLNTLIERIMKMRSANFFFKMQFCKNYFPEFVSKCLTNFMDIREIIIKCKEGEYSHIFEVIHDIRTIIYTVKLFLKTSQNTFLETSINNFEKEFNQILAEEPFENYQFDHIHGEPGEILYNFRK